MERTFDQDDVAFFLVINRDYSPRNSIFRELGDFLAHPDMKNKGLVIDDLSNVTNDFDERTEEYFSTIRVNQPIYRGLPLDKIHKELKRVFKSAGIDIFKFKIKDDCFREFIYCLIFLLSGFRVKLGDRTFELLAYYGHNLELRVEYESSQHKRNIIMLPIIILGNVWIKCPQHSYTKLEKYIVRRFDNGLLGAIKYVDDKGSCKNVEMSSFQQGELWPLVEHNF